MTFLEENTQGIPRENNEDLSLLNLTEVYIVRLGDQWDGVGEMPNYLEAIDFVVVIGILLGVFIVGIVASVHAGHMSFLRPIIPNFCLGGTADKGAQVAVANPSEEDRVSYSQDSKVDETDMKNDATEFFLADKSMSWYFIGTSLFASNIGSEHFVGQSGAGAKSGLPVAMYEWYAAVLLIMLGWIFAPVYRKSGIYTTPEFLEKRFNPATRHYLSVITCIMYVVAKLSASIYGGSLILTTTLGWNLLVSAGVCIVLACIYTITGGLRAVMYTDLLQTFIFVIGGFFVMGIVLNTVGGYSGLHERLDAQGKSDFWKLWRGPEDEHYPVTGMMLGQPFTSIWYWCMDQDLVQRVLAGKDDAHQKAGCTLAAMLKVLPPFIMIIPGIVVSTLFQFGYSDEPQYSEENLYQTTDKAYPIILTQIMPNGMRGLMIASIMAAMMSSLDSVFNAGSTIVTNDLYKVARPNATPKELTFAGRCATILFAVLSVAWIPVIQSSKGLYDMVVEIQGYLGPSIGIILCLGVTIERVNGAGAIAGLLVGGFMGMSRLVVNVMLKSDVSEFPHLLYVYFDIPFLHFSIAIVVVSAVLCLVVSFATPKKEEDVSRFMVDWSTVLKTHEDSVHYSPMALMAVNAGAIATLLATFTIWIVFI